MILAAGRGERMRPYTDKLPKPLLKVGGKHLIEHHLLALRKAGIKDIVINHAYRGAQIEEALGDGQRFGMQIEYSPEGDTGLETGGGIYKALPLLGSQPFIVVNGDIWTDYPFANLPREPSALAHLVLVDNPSFHSDGDFSLRDHYVFEQGQIRLTFSGIAVYQPAFFANSQPGCYSITPMLREAMANRHISGEYYDGQWVDVGTPERLDELDKDLRQQAID